MRNIKVFVLALVALASPATTVLATSTDVAIVVNKANGMSSLNKAQLSAIYKAKTTEFPDGSNAAAVNLPPESDARKEFDQAVLGFSPNDAKRYWIDMKIRSGIAAPPKLATPGAVARHVAKNPNGVGYVPISETSGLKVVAIVRGGQVVSP